MNKTEALKRLTRDDTEHGVEYYRADEVDAILAQPEQEPVAWINPDEQNARKAFHWVESEEFTSAVYTTPPKRPWGKPWVSLTDVKRDEILDIYLTAEGRARAIEAELKELNT